MLNGKEYNGNDSSGAVSGFRIGTGSKCGRSYTPEFEYMYIGTTYKLQSKSTSYKNPTVGETVSAFY